MGCIVEEKIISISGIVGQKPKLQQVKQWMEDEEMEAVTADFPFKKLG